MKKLLCSFCLLVLPAFVARADAPAPPVAEMTVPELRAKLAAIVNNPRFAQAELGVKFVSLAGGAVLFEHDADKLMKPASNAKMYSGALALDRLGPDYRIKTSLYAQAKPDASGTVRGDVIIYGRGDPGFAARFNNGDYSKSLQPVVAALAAAGVKHIEGGLIADESYFRGPPYGDDWTWNDLQNYYGAPVSALTVEDNVMDLNFKPGATAGAPCVISLQPQSGILHFINRTHTAAAGARGRIEIYRPVGETNVYLTGGLALDSKGTTDSVSVPNPALWFAELLKADLARQGISVGGGCTAVNWLDREAVPVRLDQWTEVASVQSRPLSEILKNTLKPSQNQYAQLLLLQVGATSKMEGGAGLSTESVGLTEMRSFLETIGIKRGSALLEEGSGLSRGALVTPSASVKLLTHMANDRHHAAFFDALPVAGVDGTLRNRFKGTPAAGNVHAKTGSLGHVDSLSGYLTTAAGERVVFSIMLNNYRGNDGRAQIDSLVTPVVAFNGKLPAATADARSKVSETEATAAGAAGPAN